MRIYSDSSLSSFQFWSGAKTNALALTIEELDQMESILEDCYPEGISETQVNDIFWFDFDWVCECLGLDVDEVYNR